MQRRLDSDQVVFDLPYKSGLPGAKHWDFIVEDEVVAFIPNAPGPNQENFHEEGVLEAVLGFVDLIKNVELFIPRDTKGRPPRNHN